MYVNWFMGTLFMVLLLKMVVFTRKMVRKNILFFIRDPNDATNDPLKYIIFKDSLTLLKKIAASGLVYLAFMILFSLTLRIAFRGIQPQSNPTHLWDVLVLILQEYTLDKNRLSFLLKRLFYHVLYINCYHLKLLNFVLAVDSEDEVKQNSKYYFNTNLKVKENKLKLVDDGSSVIVWIPDYLLLRCFLLTFFSCLMLSIVFLVANRVAFFIGNSILKQTTVSSLSLGWYISLFLVQSYRRIPYVTVNVFFHSVLTSMICILVYTIYKFNLILIYNAFGEMFGTKSTAFFQCLFFNVIFCFMIGFNPWILSM